MASVSGFRELRVWQAGMDLVETVYQFGAGFPEQERYGLTSQMRRGAISPSNIAEGHTRSYSDDYVRHLSISIASLAELETQLEIAVRLSYAPEAVGVGLLSECQALGRQLNALRSAIRQRSQAVPNPDPRFPTSETK